MNMQLRDWLNGMMIGAAAMLMAGCASEPTKEAGQEGKPVGEGAVMVAMKPGVPGGVAVGTYQETATVSAIDKEKRKVTLTTADGHKTTFTAGPDVVNFDQIQVGDQIKATVTEQLAVFVAAEAPPQSQGVATMVALAPAGAKPGGLVADTVQVKAKVTAIDLKKHKATLEFPDGSK